MDTKNRGADSVTLLNIILEAGFSKTHATTRSRA